jgi:hypothetical protein
VHLVTSNSEYIFGALRLNLTLPVKTCVVSSVPQINSLCLCPPSYKSLLSMLAWRCFTAFKHETNDKYQCPQAKVLQ